MLIAKNGDFVSFQHYDEPINVLGQKIQNVIECGELHVNIASIPSVIENKGEAMLRGDSVNMIVLSMDKKLRKQAEETHNCFVSVQSANTLERNTVLIAHKETEEGYVIDRVQQSFVVHHYHVTKDSVSLIGSQYPEMYNTTVPLIRIFSTHKDTGTIKEVIYYSDTLEPKTYYTEIGHPRYEKMASLRKSSVFLICHNGAHFETKMWVQPFCKIIVCNDYIKKMDYKFHGDVVKLLDWHYHGGMPAVIPDDMIRCIDDDIDAIKQVMNECSDYSTKKGPKWMFLGFSFATAYEARLYAQSFTERRKEHASDYGRDVKPKDKKSEEDKPKVELVIPSPPPEVYGYLQKENKRRKGKKNKREYFKKYDS